MRISGILPLMTALIIPSTAQEVNASETEDFPYSMKTFTYGSETDTGHCAFEYKEFKNAYLRFVERPNHIDYVTSYKDCFKKCCYTEKFTCKSFSYFAVSRQCFLMNVTRQDEGIVMAYSRIHVHVEIVFPEPTYSLMTTTDDTGSSMQDSEGLNMYTANILNSISTSTVTKTDESDQTTRKDSKYVTTPANSNKSLPTTSLNSQTPSTISAKTTVRLPVATRQMYSNSVQSTSLNRAFQTSSHTIRKISATQESTTESREKDTSTLSTITAPKETEKNGITSSLQSSPRSRKSTASPTPNEAQTKDRVDDDKTGGVAKIESRKRVNSIPDRKTIDGNIIQPGRADKMTSCGMQCQNGGKCKLTLKAPKKPFCICKVGSQGKYCEITGDEGKAQISWWIILVIAVSAILFILVVGTFFTYYIYKKNTVRKYDVAADRRFELASTYTPDEIDNGLGTNYTSLAWQNRPLHTLRSADDANKSWIYCYFDNDSTRQTIFQMRTAT